VGRSAAQDKTQQPLTSGGPPLNATPPQKPFPRGIRNNDVPGPWQHHQQFSYAETQISFAEGNQAGPAMPVLPSFKAI
jgi:hypothetical protein